MLSKILLSLVLHVCVFCGNVYSQMLITCFFVLAADFRLQMIDSTARIECPEYAHLQLKPVSSDILKLEIKDQKHSVHYLLPPVEVSNSQMVYGPDNHTNYH